ncbi:MAG: dTMP kinase [Alphaproteobacteria bacterium]|nr:dTMP kinase [Alphaproteobacteria bacterium]MDH5556907.1 dTMP kinase [Alphaproteobacteria bacterium]
MTDDTPGRFITLEGGEGGGKSTQAKRLAAVLKGTPGEILLTREPGGSPGAEQIRGLLVDGEVHRWDAITETFLHFAARRDHLVNTVQPALARGDWVISDRFADSTMAYQGYGHGVDKDAIAELYRICVGDLKPDLTLILDLPVEAGLARAAGRGGGEDRYERMDVSFHERLRQGFLEIARLDPARCVVIDATGDEDAVHAQIIAAVRSRLALPSAS